MKSICIYCGSSVGSLPEYRSAAVACGGLFAASGITLIYGGGNIGLMGAAADAALEAGGRVIGVIPRALMEREVGHRELTELILVESMHERKAVMAARAEGFIALPGGLGTLDELFEMLTWQQLGIHDKPVGLLNIGGYYDPLLHFLDRSVEHGFVRAQHREQLLIDTNAGRLVDRMREWKAPRLARIVQAPAP